MSFQTLGTRMYTHPFRWCSCSCAWSWWSANIPDEPKAKSFSFKTEAANYLPLAYHVNMQDCKYELLSVRLNRLSQQEFPYTTIKVAIKKKITWSKFT